MCQTGYGTVVQSDALSSIKVWLMPIQIHKGVNDLILGTIPLNTYIA